MWQSKIILPKNFSKHRQYLEDKLSKISKLSFVTKTNDHRTVIFLAAESYDEREVRRKVHEAVISLILVKIKLEFILEELELDEVGPVMSAYLSCIMNFRTPHEKKMLENILFTQKTYSLDGIINFRMNNIKEKWEELCIFSEGLLESELEEEDFYNLIIFFLNTSGRGEQSVFITEGGGDLVITNLTKGSLVPIDNIYPEPELNLINAVIAESPTEILIEEAFSSNPALNLLKKVVKVRVI